MPGTASLFFLLFSFFLTTTAASSSSSFIQFTQPEYRASIPENSMGKVFAMPETRMGIRLNATLDDGVSIKYRIKSGDPEDFFKAETEVVGDFVFLVLRTRTSNPNVLNRERVAQYALDVRARLRGRGGGGRDKRRLKGLPEPRTLVHVEVTDTNDLDPFFQPSRYAFDVDEDTALHRSVGRVRAEDADEGVNGDIYYSLLEPSKEFAVDPLTGVLSLTRQLDFRKRSRYSLTVVARDRGPKSKFASRQADTAQVFIQVKQVRRRSIIHHY